MGSGCNWMCWYNCTHGVDSDTWESARERLSNLASNLTVAGALCAAWGEGTDYGHHEAMCVCEAGVDDRTIRQYHWRPGCNRPAPGFGGES